MKLTSLSALIGRGFHGSALSGRSSRPYREARPLHTCRLAEKELLQEDFASDSESPVGRGGEQAFVQPMREEGTVVHNGGDIKIYYSNSNKLK